jgi:hypothetical protein|tara:strand:- start:1005 stop:1406 length:402 start_codon:yes stop_codon:yes gene_type:complete
MADLLVTLSNPRGNLIYTQSAATKAITDVQNNIFAKTAPKVYAIKLDNSANTTEAVYMKLYGDTTAAGSAVTVGTTNPLLVMKAGAGKSVEMYMPGGIAVGSGQYLHVAVVTGAGVAGTTDPTGTVALTITGE